MDESLSYPVGRFHVDGDITGEQRQSWMSQIAEAPAKFRAAFAGLSEAQIETAYRPGGWTLRQVAHHVPDSHMNSYIRFRLALTEPEPTVKPYEQDRWAELADSRTAPIEWSLTLLESLHSRWMVMLRSISGADWKRAFKHPDLGLMTLEKNLALYAWHGRHHTAHVTSLRQRMNW